MHSKSTVDSDIVSNYGAFQAAIMDYIICGLDSTCFVLSILNSVAYFVTKKLFSNLLLITILTVLTCRALKMKVIF